MAVVHKHLIIRAEVRNPLKDEQAAILWVRNLVQNIGMNIMMGPFAQYLDVEGNRGLTAVAIIETSHIALHVWDECDPALVQLDVYTCGALDPQQVVDALRAFDPVRVEMKYLDREHDLTELPL